MLCFLLCKKQRCVHFVGALRCKNAFDAEHFPLENVQLCKNAFDAKMHLMQKCCVFCFAKNKDATLTFCLQNVRKRQNAFWLCKNAFDAKMHFGNASHFPKENVQHHIFQRKMFSITFSKGKCSATQCVHFPKENVQFYLEQPTFS